MSFFCLGLSSTFALDWLIQRDGGMDAGIIEVRIVIPPTVVILFRYFAVFEPGRLFLPGTETLFKVGTYTAGTASSVGIQPYTTTGGHGTPNGLMGGVFTMAW